LLSYLISDRKYKGVTKLCLLSGYIPNNVEKSWYVPKILIENIRTVCSLNIVKTESGKRMKVTEVIFPNIPKGAEEFSEKRIVDLMNILKPVYQKDRGSYHGDS
jgi:hypothetical protein